MAARRWKRKYRRLERSLAYEGAVPKVRMQLPDGTWAYGVFIPFRDASRRNSTVDFYPRPTHHVSSRPRRG